MSIHEDLSRLLDGDLNDDEAAALRARIEAEPDVAAAWAVVSALPADLARLDAEAPVPPGLDDLVLGGRDRQPAMRSFSRRWGKLAAAAAAIGLIFFWTRPQTTSVIVAGSHYVDGIQSVRAGAVTVDVEGRALISVEPPEGLLRDSGQEVLEMNKSHLLSALAGAVVTVTVYQGAAVVRAGEAAPVTVAAGEAHTVGSPDPAPSAAAKPPQVLTPPRPVEPGLTPAEREAVLNDEIARLRDELQTAELRADLARGRVEAHEGTPAPWPADLPAAFGPEGFTEAIAAALEEVPFGTLHHLDCSEYPCYAVIESHSTEDNWGAVVDEFADVIRDHTAVPTGMWQQLSTIGTDHGSLAFAGITFGPSDGEEPDEELRRRLDFRVRSAIEDVAEDRREDLRAEAGAD